VIDIALKNLYETLSIMENYHSWFYFWSSKKLISLLENYLGFMNTRK
jgi:hypothetical protein